MSNFPHEPSNVPPSDPTPTQLAADVRKAIAVWQDGSKARLSSVWASYAENDLILADSALAALDALVARITDLEALAEERGRERDETNYSLNHCRGLLDAAEAQVAALTRERDLHKSEREKNAAWAGRMGERAEAAEAQLATTRQALAEIAELYELGPASEIARRALADTEPE